MFTLNHFIWLFISAGLIVVFLFLTARFKIKYEYVISFMLCLSVVSTLLLYFINMEDALWSGMRVRRDQLPFHLCSMQLFVFTILKILRKDKSEQLLAFSAVTCLVGACISLLIPTEGVTFERVQTYQYFIYHSLLVAYGIYVVREKFVKWNLTIMLRDIEIMTGCVITVFTINSFLADAGTNYMFLTRPPMDNLPFLNLDHGWYVYICHLFILGLFLLASAHLIIMLITKEKKKTK